MNRQVYQERRTYQRYDETHIIGYLNEEVIKDYQPAIGQQPGGEQERPEPWPMAYAYTGNETDGGTVMPCKDPTSYNEVTNAIIRTHLSESEEMSVLRHHQNDAGKYADEWQAYNDVCESAKLQARKWLGID